MASQSFLDKFTPSTAEIGLVASLLTAGAFVGAAIAGTISDYFGRRGTILSGGLVFLSRRWSSDWCPKLQLCDRRSICRRNWVGRRGVIPDKVQDTDSPGL